MHERESYVAAAPAPVRSSVGTITVLDLILLVAASSVSILLMKRLLPATPTLRDFLHAGSHGAPVGLALFGPWAVRRQFVDGTRDELQAGEWLWIGLGAIWITSLPILMFHKSEAIHFLADATGIVAGVLGVLGFVHSLIRFRGRSWTHWAGVLLCLIAGASPVLSGLW